jgi:hypothetical protein
MYDVNTIAKIRTDIGKRNLAIKKTQLQFPFKINCARLAQDRRVRIAAPAVYSLVYPF